MGFADFLDDFFDVSVRGSTLGGEVRAGLASFLTVSYILLVNPQILSQSGIPAEDVATATAASAALGSFIAGILGNLPFIIGPGMGLSAYLTFGLIAAGTLTKTQALTSCMVSGVLILLATVTGVANILQKLTAQHIKTAIVVGMGLLIALIGMVQVSRIHFLRLARLASKNLLTFVPTYIQVDLVIAADDGSLVQLGDLSDWKIWLSLGGLVLIGTLAHFSIDGGILFGIISCTMVYWGITGEWPTSWVQVPSLETAWSDNIDLSSLDGNCVMPILAFFFVAIFDVSGVIFGLGKLAGIQQEDETVPGEVWGFIASGAGTVLAAGMGSTPIIAEVGHAHPLLSLLSVVE
jgi:AGZA family xanthine/uracil permease-like MFS transporter